MRYSYDYVRTSPPEDALNKLHQRYGLMHKDNQKLRAQRIFFFFLVRLKPSPILLHFSLQILFWSKIYSTLLYFQLHYYSKYRVILFITPFFTHHSIFNSI